MVEKMNGEIKKNEEEKINTDNREDSSIKGWGRSKKEDGNE